MESWRAYWPRLSDRPPLIFLIASAHHMTMTNGRDAGGLEAPLAPGGATPMGRSERMSHLFFVAPHELDKNHALFNVLIRRSIWFVRLRWLVPPTMVAVAAAAWLLGLRFHVVGVLCVATFVLCYNVVFSLLRNRVVTGSSAYVEKFTHAQVAADYAAMFALIHCTGGISSPLILFLLFHIILAAILLPPVSAWVFSAAAVLGLVCIALVSHVTGVQHVLQHGSILLAPITDRTLTVVVLSCFTAAAFTTAYVCTNILRMLRRSMLDLVESQSTLKRVGDERERFMLTVTHNLRAPVAAAMSHVDLLIGNYLGSLTEQQHGHLDRLQSRLRSLLDTISELLAVARYRYEVRQIQRLPVDLARLSEQVFRVFVERCEQKGMKLTIDCPSDESLLVIGDAKLLEEAMENLVSNAVKYTAHGQITLTLCRAEPWIMIRVEDTGMGIPSADQGKLFTEFFRAHNARALDAGSTGLGLTIVKQTVEQHGGSIEVRSHEGSGSVFTIWLPVIEDEEATESTKPETQLPHIT